jgi:hypothetical protein
LLHRLRALVKRGHELEAELIEHLAEVDLRRLYLPRRSSLWDFCINDLGFSDDAACNRIGVARESRRFPAMLDALRSGRIHLSGLKMLCGHLTAENCEELLAEATGKTKRRIAEILVRRQPKPVVPDAIRKLPSRSPSPGPSAEPEGLFGSRAEATPTPTDAPIRRPPPPSVVPLAPELYKFEFSGDRELRDQFKVAQDLLRHQIPTGDMAKIVSRALALLIAEVKKERWSVGRKPRAEALPEGPATSRDIPDAIKRAVYERDGGRCTYVDSEGRRCDEQGWLELDHEDGFARVQEHRVDRIRLRCRGHNVFAADQLYGREWMDERRERGKTPTPSTSDAS